MENSLGKRQYRNLLVINELYQQQNLMFEQRVHSVKDRIISISQPHIRPIVRGKAKAKAEFGAKVSASVVDGFCFADRISFDTYDEGEDVPSQIEAFRRRYGHYPVSVHADKIYGNRKKPRLLQKARHSIFRPQTWTPPQSYRSKCRRTEIGKTSAPAR